MKGSLPEKKKKNIPLGHRPKVALSSLAHCKSKEEQQKNSEGPFNLFSLVLCSVVPLVNLKKKNHEKINKNSNQKKIQKVFNFFLDFFSEKRRRKNAIAIAIVIERD